MRRPAILLTICLALAGCGSAPSKPPQPVAAAGVQDATPILAQWKALLKPWGVALGYTATSPAAAHAALAGGAASIAILDQPIAPADLLARDQLAVPVALSAVAVVYDLPGIADGLHLDPVVLRQILGGRIARWDDPAIAALNPGVTLPATAIRVVRRADPSTLSDALALYTGAPPGAGSALTGERAVAAQVASTPGAIGYVSQAYAAQLGLTAAWLRNVAGVFVAPTIAATTAATARPALFSTPKGKRLPVTLPVTTVGPPGSASPAAYPVFAAYYAIVPRDVCRASGQPKSVAKLTADALGYMLGDGQFALQQMDNTPLPSEVASDAQAVAGLMRCDGAKVF
jgi:phosphate transport system substrate-binding protein